MDALVAVPCYLIVGNDWGGGTADDAIIIPGDGVIGDDTRGIFAVDAMAAISCYTVIGDSAGGGCSVVDAKPAISRYGVVGDGWRG